MCDANTFFQNKSGYFVEKQKKSIIVTHEHIENKYYANYFIYTVKLDVTFKLNYDKSLGKIEKHTLILFVHKRLRVLFLSFIIFFFSAVSFLSLACFFAKGPSTPTPLHF